MEKILFAPLTKVVELADGTVEVWGRAAAQEPDPAGEVFDYEASKPFIQAWSDEIFAASGGKSLGNLRAMHNPKVAAGKLTRLEFLDAEKAVDVVAQVMDAGEVKKTRAGVYTGFSFGGAYGPKRPVGNLVYYAAIPSELSLADNPMIKSARFTLVKVDGTQEEREFRKAKEGDYGAKADAGYADPGYQVDKKPRYPLKINGELSEKRIRAALNYISKPKNAGQYGADDLAKIKAKIMAAWKEKIDPEGPPSAAQKLQKAMWHIGSYAETLQNLKWLLDDLDWEAVREMDDSPVPERFRAWLEQGVEILGVLAAEVIGELLADLQSPAPLMRAEQPGLHKAGARHTAAEMEMIQQIHDHAQSLGAACGEKKVEKNMKPEELQKLQGAVDGLAKLEADFAAQGERLAKVEAENQELKDRLAKVEAEPAPAKAAAKAVTKEEDVLNKTDAPTQEEMIKNKDTLGLIKAAQANPIFTG